MSKPATDLLRKTTGVFAKRGEEFEPIELWDKRNEYGKTFYLGNNRYHRAQSIGPVHYWDNGWWDIDLTLHPVETEGGLVYRMDKAAYTVEVMPDRVAWRYYSRAGGYCDVELLEVDGQPVDYSGMEHRVQDNIMFWDNVAPDVDVKLVLYRKKVEDFKRFVRPTELKWRVVQSEGFAGKFNDQLAGWDKKGDRLEIEASLDGETFVERWTGRVSRVEDRRTRRKKWQNDPALPVIVDAAIQENIVADVDDGVEVAGAWYTTFYGGVRMGYSNFGLWQGGFRFQSLALPSGVTISAATMTLNIKSLTSDPSMTLYGDDVDDAAAWSNGNLPSGITKTTASVAVAPSATGTGYAIGITDVVDEIAARGGWTSGGDMRFGVLGANAPGFKLMIAEDYSEGGGNEAQLDVTYTAAATSTAYPSMNPGGRKHFRMVSR